MWETCIIIQLLKSAYLYIFSLFTTFTNETCLDMHITRKNTKGSFEGQNNKTMTPYGH